MERIEVKVFLMKKDEVICTVVLATVLVISSMIPSICVEAAEVQSTVENNQTDESVEDELSEEKEMSTEEITETKGSISKLYDFTGDIEINTEVFNSTQVRLNTELYITAEESYNKQHVIKDFGVPATKLAESYVDAMNPLIPVAMTVNETGMWADRRYTWTSGVYSKLLKNAGCNMDRLDISTVTTDTYVVNNLCTYYGCGKNCTAGKSTHYHTIGTNDSDSLGPLQILRHYVEDGNYIEYDCGDTVVDLMSWEDNVTYFTHTQSNKFMSPDNWNRDYSISNTYELVALMAVAHNTGTSFLVKNDAGSLWHNSTAVYKYCHALGNEDSVRILSGYVDDWWSTVIAAQAEGKDFILLGQSPTNLQDRMLSDLGIVKSDYASSFGHKQYYPLKALLNYMCLERLYYSGRLK